MTRKIRRNRDSNFGSSALEADALTTRPTRRSFRLNRVGILNTTKPWPEVPVRRDKVDVVVSTHDGVVDVAGYGGPVLGDEDVARAVEGRRQVVEVVLPPQCRLQQHHRHCQHGYHPRRRFQAHVPCIPTLRSLFPN